MYSGVIPFLLLFLEVIYWTIDLFLTKYWYNSNEFWVSLLFLIDIQSIFIILVIIPILLIFVSFCRVVLLVDLIEDKR